MLRKIFLKIHLYVGLTTGLLFALIGLTGSLLVFSEEIDAALNPGFLRAAPLENKAALKRILENVARSFPEDKIYRVKMPRRAEDVYEFWMNANGDTRVYVNPYTGEILGRRLYGETLRGRLFYLHTQILSGETGKTIVGFAAFFFLLIGLSGIVLWWRGTKNIKRRLTIKFRSGWKRANYDAHHAVGFFAFFFLGISALTGIHLIFNAPFEKTVNWLTRTPTRQPAPTSKLVEGIEAVPLDEIAARSESVLPNAETTWLYPPANKTAAYMIRKRLPSENHPNGKSFVFIDQYSGEVLRVENAEEAPAAGRFINNLYPLHIGIMGGTPTRLWQFLVGLSPSILLLTGFFMWRNRQKRRKD